MESKAKLYDSFGLQRTIIGNISSINLSFGNMGGGGASGGGGGSAGGSGGM
eukprot:SAG31_NODE_48328_length_194_cov_14.189474_1_plen_50_part_10